MIINIRGTSGSGKTYVVRELMQHIRVQTGCDWIELINEKGKVITHVTYFDWQPIHVLGNYSGSLCGGCDTISSHNMLSSLVRHFSQFGHVIFEGMTISRSYARFAALDDYLTSSGEKYIWAILDTPLELCLERVQQRRDERH
jgi:adenylate kinase family enzyme